MMGWGGIEPHLRTLAAKADPSATKVRFIPPAPQQELCDWSAGAALGVIPYENTCLNHWFCTPNKLWEYPSSGVPVIASAFPELRRPIDTAGIGMLLPSPLNERTLHDLIAGLSATDHRRMKAACRRFVETEHWEVFADRLVRAYREWLAVPTPIQHVLFWGGLRGALALALALGLPPDMPQANEIVRVTFAVVAFSVFVQGLTMGPLLRRLGEVPASMKTS